MFWILGDFESKFSNASSFEEQFIQRVKEWIDKKNVLDFELIFFQHLTFWNNVCIQKIRFGNFFLLENDIFCFFPVFLKSLILNWSFFYVSSFELKKHNASGLEFNKIQRVRFWVETFTTCQILYQLLKHASVFDMIVLRVGRLCTSSAVCQIFMCSTKQGTFQYCFTLWCGSVSQVILLG